MRLKDRDVPTRVQTKTISDNTMTYGQFTFAQSMGRSVNLSMKCLPRRATNYSAEKRCEAVWPGVQRAGTKDVRELSGSPVFAAFFVKILRVHSTAPTAQFSP